MSPRTRRASRTRNANEKMRLLETASSLDEKELGGFLRQHALHVGDLQRWRKEALQGLSAEKQNRQRASKEQRTIRELEKELQRKEKALAETAALLVLQKKVQVLWGDEVGDTPGRNER